LKYFERFLARGHNCILAEHKRTFEITKASSVTKRGDCIIAVSSTKAPRDFSSGFRSLCLSRDTQITIELWAAGRRERIVGWGDEKLTLTNPNEIVGRKSTYTSDRTFMVEADKAACDLDRRFVRILKNPSTVIKVIITAEN